MSPTQNGDSRIFMTEIIGVRFKNGGKVYSFAPNDFNPAEGSYVMVETARGLECGEVAARRHAVADESITAPLKPILRLATQEDMKILEQNKAYMADAFRVCEERIAARELPMRLVDVECGFDSNKLIFYFTAESRVDFRELVKDLASAFHVRIELRQIGDRDEAKLLGGLGICGREFCCKGYLSDFQPITIKMAKEQGLALNPTKISGTCGRLMCCLRYESPVYEELIRFTPKVGSTVLLAGDPPVRAYVMEANLITGKLRVKPENAEMPITVDREDVERLQDMTKRMTKDDLRDSRRDGAQRTTAAKPPAANLAAAEQKAAEAKPHQDAAEESAQPQQNQGKPQRPPRQNNQQRPQRQNRPQQEQKTQDNTPNLKAAPVEKIPAASTPPAATAEPITLPIAETAALHPEFGETKQVHSGQEQPQKHTAIHFADMDLTEHRAVTEKQAATNAAAQPAEGDSAQKSQHGGKNYHHGGGNRRFYHHGNNRQGGGKQGSPNGGAQGQNHQNRPPRPPKTAD